MAIISWDYTLRQPSRFESTLYEDVVQTQGLFGKRTTPLRRYTEWRFIVTWPVTNSEQQGRLRGFLSRIIGSYDTLNLPIFDRRVQVGTKTGVVTFGDDHVIGDTSITIAGGSGQLVMGDIIQPHGSDSGGLGHTYMVRQGEDVLGANLISIWPPLRLAYDDGDSIVKTIDPSTNGYMLENVELAGELTFGPMMRGGNVNLYDQFTLEFVSALR